MQILIADDHQIFRQGLRLLLDSQPDVDVVAETGDGRSAVRLAAEHSPDVIVMDVSMPDLNGIDATRQIIAAASNGKIPKIIALSAHSDGHLAQQMLAAGACGYVVKHSTFPEMMEALSAVMAGKIYLSPTLPNVAGTQSAPASDSSRLSPREREILQLLAEGKAMKEIAA